MNMTADTTSTWLLAHTPTHFQKMIATNYSYGIERDEEKLKANNLDHRKWTNPLEVQYVQYQAFCTLLMITRLQIT